MAANLTGANLTGANLTGANVAVHSVKSVFPEIRGIG
jgi:uncharacterized protein YjbI with pentapeptide repeats